MPTKRKLDWEKIRVSILERDNFKCQICGLSKKMLESTPRPFRLDANSQKYYNLSLMDNLVAKFQLIVHHINFNKSDNRMENLITLCNSCHGYISTNPAASQRAKGSELRKKARNNAKK